MIIYNKPQTNYTKISNAFLQDTNISAEAKIVGILLMSYPNNWSVQVENLANTLQKSVRTIRKAIKELIDSKKLCVTQERKKSGQYSENTCYTFIDENQSEIIGEIEAKEEETLKESLAFVDFKEEVIKESTQAENKELQPSGKKTACGENAHVNNNNIINKNKIYITRESKKQILLDLCFTPLLKLDISFLNSQELEAYKAFIAYRKEKGKVVLTTQKAILAKLRALKESGENLIECIKQSIEKGWSGLFPQNKSFKISKQALSPKVSNALKEQSKPLSQKEQLELELKELFKAKYPDLHFDRVPNGRVFFLNHKSLGLVGVYKEHNRLNLYAQD